MKIGDEIVKPEKMIGLLVYITDKESVWYKFWGFIRYGMVKYSMFQVDLF